MNKNQPEGSLDEVCEGLTPQAAARLRRYVATSERAQNTNYNRRREWEWRLLWAIAVVSGVLFIFSLPR